jgi:hypothetical protein
MPSGKQVLLKVLQEYSQKRQEESDLKNVSEVVKSALCAHCSTSGETMEKISDLGWLSYTEDGRIVKQGLGLVKPNVFLSDLFEELIEDTKIPERVSARFPNITQDQYTFGLDMIWWVLSSLQYWEELSSVENGGVLEESEAKKLINGYKKWLRSYEKESW